MSKAHSGMPPIGMSNQQRCQNHKVEQARRVFRIRTGQLVERTVEVCRACERRQDGK